MRGRLSRLVGGARVPAELDSDAVEVREDVHHDRLPALEELGQLARVILDLEDLVLDRHRLERTDLERHLVGDPEEPEARARGPQEVGVLLVNLEDLA